MPELIKKAVKVEGEFRLRFRERKGVIGSRCGRPSKRGFEWAGLVFDRCRGR